MKNASHRPFLLSTCLTFALTLTTAAWARSTTPAPLAPHVPGEIIVKFKKGMKHSFLEKKAKLGLIHARHLPVSFGEFSVFKTVQKSLDLSKAIKLLSSLPEVEYAEPNFIYRTQDFQVAAPNDPKFDVLWGLTNLGDNEPGSDGRRSGTTGVKGADVDALKAWDITRGSKDIRIAVIDTGIDYTHPDLKDNMWRNEAELNGESGKDDDGNGYVDDIYGYDFANKDADPMDGHGHGTHCAGTIGATHDNNTGVAGVMGQVSLVALKFLADNGSGNTTDAILAIDYATKLDVDIMSNSWGGGGFSQALFEAIKRAEQKGILFVAAAGNDGRNNDNSAHYPSNYEATNVVSVAAHTVQDKLASFSNYGKKTVHIAAPGHNILSTVKGANYAVYSGTSMATPHVSGALGLLVAKEGRLPLLEVRERLLMTSTPIQSYRGQTMKGGRLNAYNLLTDSRPERNEPDPDKWISYPLTEKFESKHPYSNNELLKRVVTVPGAKFVRAVVKQFDLETGWDFFYVLEPQTRTTVDKFSGKGESKVTEHVEGESIELQFKADQVETRWGFVVEEVQYQ